MEQQVAFCNDIKYLLYTDQRLNSPAVPWLTFNDTRWEQVHHVFSLNCTYDQIRYFFYNPVYAFCFVVFAKFKRG